MKGGKMKKLAITLVFSIIFLLGFVSWGGATVITYSDEASFLSALSGYDTVFEGFEDSVWDPTRSGTYGTITNLGITWDASEKLTTGSGWARTGNYGVYNSYGDPDILYSASSTDLLYGVGGWFKGYDDNLTIKLDGSSVATITPSSPHEFFGVIDTEGFNAVTFYSDYHFGADDFTFASNPVPEPTTMLLLGMGLIGLAGARRRKR
jgi:hypothetical protein